MRTKPVAFLSQQENISFYIERRANYGFYDADYWEVILPINGNTEISYDGKKRMIARGTVAFFAPHIKKRVTLRTEGGEYVSVRINTEAIEKTLGFIDEASYKEFSGLTTLVREISEAHVQDVLEGIEYIHLASETDREILLKKLVYRLFLPLVPFRFYDPSGDVVQRTLYVMNNPHNVSLRLPDVAERVGCSEEYLVRCFKKAKLETPNTIFKRIKLRYAKSLISSTKISVSEVATIIGFRSVGHFNKLYFSEYGVCPGTDKLRP